MLCPSCPAQPLALFVCDDGVYRCYQCKTKRPVATAFPLRAKRPAPKAPAPEAAPTTITEHEAIMRARVVIRNRIARIEGLSDWDKSPWNCGKHEGLSEALEILKGTAQ